MKKPILGKWYNIWEDDLPAPDKKNPNAKCKGYTRSKEILVLDNKGNKFSAYCMCSDYEIMIKGKDEPVMWETLKGKFLDHDTITHWMPLPVNPPPHWDMFTEEIAGQWVEIKYKEDCFRPVIEGRPMHWVGYKEGVDYDEQLQKIVSRIRTRLEKKVKTKKKTKKKKARPKNARK